MSRRAKKKRAKKRPPIAKKQRIEAMKAKMNQPAPTHNAKIIRDLMMAVGVKGNFKDYVIIAGKRLIEWADSYDLLKIEDGKTTGLKSMALIHKRKLRDIVGEDMAAEFWDHKLGRRRPSKTRPQGVRKE